jgi:transposase
MRRDELERLSKAELIELVLRLQRPAKTSRTSSKPPSTGPKERREHAKPGGAKPGHGATAERSARTPTASSITPRSSARAAALRCRPTCRARR